MLVDMGFPLLSAEQALEMCGQEVQKAVHLLTTGELLDDNEVKEIHNFFTKKTKLKDSPQGLVMSCDFIWCICDKHTLLFVIYMHLVIT